MPNLYLPVTAFLLSLILLVIYFSKKRVNLIENHIYILMIFSILMDSALVSLIFYNYYTNYNENLVKLLNKIDYAFLILWASSLMLYIFTITYKDVRNFKQKFNIACISCLILDVIMTVVVFNSNISLIIKDAINQTAQGPAVTISIIFCLFYVFVSLIMVLLNFKKISIKHLPVFIIIFTAILIAILFSVNPYLIIISMGLTIDNFIMYFTIENPDLKLINELNVAKTNLEKANNVKTDFLKSMSHEIRTPMNQIIGCASILEYEDNLSSEGKETLHDLSTATNSLLDVCSGIINVSQIESGNATLEMSEYNPEELFDEIIKLNSKLINGKNITFEKEYNNLPDKLYGDKEKVKQIVSNIFNNAVKYTEKGYVKLKVNSSLEENKCNLEIIIEDTGKGIKEENKDLIFDKFGRETKDTDKLGLGLGLTIAKSLVEMLNGKIEFTSEEGKGTTFAVNIKQDLEEVNKVDLSEKKVLILHTSNILKTYIRKILEKYEIKVYEASKCSEALEFLEDNKCDVVLTDILIEKEMSVKEFALISKFEKELNIKIITIGRVENTTGHDYEGYAFDGYVSENLNENEIINKIKEVLK